VRVWFAPWTCSRPGLPVVEKAVIVAVIVSVAVVVAVTEVRLPSVDVSVCELVMLLSTGCSSPVRFAVEESDRVDVGNWAIVVEVRFWVRVWPAVVVVVDVGTVAVVYVSD